MKLKFVDSLLLILGMVVIGVSCEEASGGDDYADTDLLKKVVAVQNQIQKQGNISEKEKQAILSLASLVSSEGLKDAMLDEVMSFTEVDRPPVFPGCENAPDDELKDCFIEKITDFVSSEFDTSIAKNLNLSGPQRIVTVFKVGADGNVSKIKVRNNNLVLQAEGVRVIKMLPKMLPASHKEAKVAVMYTLPIVFEIQN